MANEIQYWWIQSRTSKENYLYLHIYELKISNNHSEQRLFLFILSKELFSLGSGEKKTNKKPHQIGC